MPDGSLEPESDEWQGTTISGTVIGGKRISCLGLGMRRDRAGFMGGPVLGLMFSCHQLDILKLQSKGTCIFILPWAPQMM